MALEPRAVTVAGLHQSSLSRAGAGQRVSSQSQDQVEETNLSSSVDFDASPSNLYNSRSELDKDSRRHRQPERNFSRLFMTDSEAFARLFEPPLKTSKISETAYSQKGSVSSNQAVQTYENNFNLITGAVAVRGTSLSLIL